MSGHIRYFGGQPYEVVAGAQWQNLHDTILGNRRKRKPEWIILFSESHLGFTGESTHSVNNRMTRDQAKALVEVLSLALAEEPTDGIRREFVSVKDGAGHRVVSVPESGRNTYDDYRDLMEYAQDHLDRADKTNGPDNLPHLERAIERLNQAVAAARTGFAPAETLCRECSNPMAIGIDGSPGVSHHIDEDGAIDHDADLDHVAIAEVEP